MKRECQIARNNSGRAQLGLAILGSIFITGCGTHTTPITVTVPPGDVVTYHNDLARTGQYPYETVLNRTNVAPASFGKVASLPVDGVVYAQTLFAQGVVTAKGTYDLLLVETEHDSVYAFDATGLSKTPIWKRSFLGDGDLPCSGCTTLSVADINAPNIYPEIGITATPVIDPSGQIIYILAATKENGNYFQKLHALDLKTGNELPGSPVAITATAAGGGFGANNGVLTFDPHWQLSRAGLALSGGTLFFGFSSFDDQEGSHGWFLAYDASTLKQLNAFVTTPNSGLGSIWGGAPAIDDAGIVYFSTANADPNFLQTPGDYGNSVMKLSSRLQVFDYFTPYDNRALDISDIDLGSGGVLLVPDQPGSGPVVPAPLLIAGGKEGTVYVVNRDNMGHFNTDPNANSDPQIIQEVRGIIPGDKSDGPGIYGTPSYFNNTVFTIAAGDYLRSWPIMNDQLEVSLMTKANEYIPLRGATASISSNGAANGIIWFLNASAYTYHADGTPITNGPSILMAYNTDDISAPLYRSDHVPADAAGFAVKFAVPTVANGRVYVGTQTEVSVYGTH